MAVKKGESKIYNLNHTLIAEIIKDERFQRTIDAEFIEEAITPQKHEFRFIRKTTAARYGRNIFISINDAGNNSTTVNATVQSRKITVLIDTSWKKEVERIFSALDILTELAMAKSE